MNKGDDVKPYLLPPLGRHYIEAWAEEEQVTVPSRGRSNSPARREGSIEVSKSNHHAESSSSISNNKEPSTTFKTGGKAGTTTPTATTGKGEGEKEVKEEEQKPEPIPERARYLKSTEPLTDDYLMMEDLSCGGLTERLLSTLVIEDMVDLTELKNLALLDDSSGEGTREEEEDDMDLDSVSSSEGGRTVVELSNNPTEEIVDFEERLKRELRYAGLFGDEDVWFYYYYYLGWDNSR